MKKASILFAAGLLLTACTAPPKHSDTEASMKDSTNPLSGFMFDDSDTDSSSSQSDSQQTNFLGGTGEINVIDNENNLFLQDREWFYIGEYKMKKQGASLSLKSQCKLPGCSHDQANCPVYQYYRPAHHLMSGGETLYIAEKNKLMKIDRQGNTTELMSITADSDQNALDPQSVAYTRIFELNDGWLLCFANGYNQSDTFCKICVLYQTENGTLQYLDSGIREERIEIDAAHDQFFCMKSDGEIYGIRYTEGAEHHITDALDDHPTIDGWVTDDQCLYYINLIGQYCKYDLAKKEKMLIMDTSPFEGFYPQNGSVYTVDHNRNEILRGNPEWSKTEIIYSSDSQIEGITAIGKEWLFVNTAEGGRIVNLSSGEGFTYE